MSEVMPDLWNALDLWDCCSEQKPMKMVFFVVI